MPNGDKRNIKTVPNKNNVFLTLRNIKLPLLWTKNDKTFTIANSVIHCVVLNYGFLVVRILTKENQERLSSLNGFPTITSCIEAIPVV